MRCVQQPCTNCKKHGNTCLQKVIDLYGDVDLGACIWCSVRGVGCSISQRGKGARGARSPKKDFGKRKVSKVSEGEDSDKGRVAKKVRPIEVMLARSLPPAFTPLPPPLPSPATPLFLSSPPSPVPSEV